MLRTRTYLALALALVLSLPAAALAQNAGDQQYTDPLAPGQSDPGGSGSGGGGGNAPPPSGSAAGTPETGEQQPATEAQAGSSGPQLPRTGFPAGLMALAGGGMLAAGAALRRRVS